MKIWSELLAISLLASSCAAPMAATMPAAAVLEPSDAQIEDGVAETTFHGIPGVFFTFEAWRNVVIKTRLQRKDLEVALASETVGREVAEVEAATLRANQSRTQWAATFGPWLGFAGGLTVAAVVAGILGGVFNGVANAK